MKHDDMTVLVCLLPGFMAEENEVVLQGRGGGAGGGRGKSAWGVVWDAGDVIHEARSQ
jgi:hypothetical protein